MARNAPDLRSLYGTNGGTVLKGRNYPTNPSVISDARFLIMLEKPRNSTPFAGMEDFTDDPPSFFPGDARREPYRIKHATPVCLTIDSITMAVFSKVLVALIAASVVVGQAQPWAQCGGLGFTGPTTCTAGWTCVVSNAYYSQCLQGTATTTATTTPPATTSTPPATTSTPATTTTTATPPSGSSPAKGVIGTDFEGTVDGSVWSVIVTAQSGGSATIDTTKAHSGTHSMKIVSTGGFSNHIFYGVSNLTALGSGSDIYGRYYANFLNAFTQDHTTHMMMTDPVAQTLRMGGQFGVLDWNRASDDSIMPDGSPTSNAGSIAIAGNTWYCIEFHLSRTTGQIQTWVGGNAISSLTTPQTRWGSSYIPNPSNWGLGWESYGSDPNTVWYDDIALGTSRIGC
ncbi:hypothetical protein B0H19DRAFT_1273608 [Mycena capillaripes]|nr:hypothetical protein B0H19DRAFT_1273608 [Mycena capillaripes]